MYGKHKVCGLCQVVPDWARLGGSHGEASILLDAGQNIEFDLLVFFVELATKLICGRFKGRLFRKILCDWYTGIRHINM